MENIEQKTSYILAGIYLLKVSNRSTRKKVWNMFKVNNKNTRTTSHLVLVFLLLTFSCSNFAQWSTKINLFPIFSHPFVLNAPFLYPPENIRKPYGTNELIWLNKDFWDARHDMALDNNWKLFFKPCFLSCFRDLGSRDKWKFTTSLSLWRVKSLRL